jgi:hypothetical protein
MLMFPREVLVLSTIDAAREVFGATRSLKEIEQALVSCILALSFADEHTVDGQIFSYSCVVFAQQGDQRSSSISTKAFSELVFFGSSDVCLDLALAVSSQADAMMVVGTRSRDQIIRMAQQYCRRLSKLI